MLDFHKDKNDLLGNKSQEIISKNYVSIFGNPKKLCHCCVDVRYSRHEMSYSPLKCGAMFY